MCQSFMPFLGLRNNPLCGSIPICWSIHLSEHTRLLGLNQKQGSSSFPLQGAPDNPLSWVKYLVAGKPFDEMLICFPGGILPCGRVKGLL